jgi:thiamine biosynthesis lipoprotein
MNTSYLYFLRVCALKVYLWGLLFGVVLPFSGQAADAAVRVALQGTTMGTRYSVTYVDADDARRAAIHAEIGELFTTVDGELSNWNPQSWVSRWNRNESLDTIEVPSYAAEVLRIALQIAEQSGGAMDPTISPLIELWGFGASKDWIGPPLDFEIEQILEVCGYTRVEFDPVQRVVRKGVSQLQLNLSAVAKGYAVDQVAALLDAHGLDSHLINIGGEVRASGLRPDGRAWTVKIAHGGVASAQFDRAITLRDASIATSGFSQRFFVWEGQRFAHLIDPRSGKPVSNAVSSVSVRAENCALADGWATACCVLGFEAGMALIESLDGVDAVFYLEDDAGKLVERVSSGW